MKDLKKILIIALLMVSVIGTNAQKESKREKMEALKIAFITEKLDLTKEESQKFWPVFNQYQKDKKAISERKKGDKKPDFDSMSDSEIENFIDSKLVKAQNLLNLRKEYLGEFKKVLPIRKVAKLIQAERNFKREVLKRLKQSK